MRRVDTHGDDNVTEYYRGDTMTYTTYYATPRHWMSALDVLEFTIRCCELAGKTFVGSYLESPNCFAVVVEEAA